MGECPPCPFFSAFLTGFAPWGRVCAKGGEYLKQFKVVVEKHPDGYVAYPLGFKGVVVGEGDTYEEALADVKSAIRFHIETFGQEVLETGSRVRL